MMKKTMKHFDSWWNSRPISLEHPEMKKEFIRFFEIVRSETISEILNTIEDSMMHGVGESIHALYYNEALINVAKKIRDI